LEHTAPNDWPTFAVPRLQSLAQAFLRRRRAMKYMSTALVVSSEKDGDVPDEVCHLCVDIASHQDRPAHARLFVWPNGDIWFQAYQPRQKGWNFHFSFTGTLGGAACRDIVGWFEESFFLACSSGGGDANIEKILEIWRVADPILDDAA